MAVEILFEDNHLLAVNKPAGLVTQKTLGHASSLEENVALLLQERTGKPRVFLHAVHRLDRVTSGIVLFAKTSKALQRLQEQQRARAWKKVYLALLEDKLVTNEGELKDYVVHEHKRARIATAEEKQAKSCLLRYKFLKFVNESALYQVHLETGRFHQIRIQLASRGCPVQGDVKYGAQKPFHYGGVALHHSKLTVPHPVTKEQINIIASDPHWSLH